MSKILEEMRSFGFAYHHSQNKNAGNIFGLEKDNYCSLLKDGALTSQKDISWCNLDDALPKQGLSIVYDYDSLDYPPENPGSDPFQPSYNLPSFLRSAFLANLNLEDGPALSLLGHPCLHDFLVANQPMALNAGIPKLRALMESLPNFHEEFARQRRTATLYPNAEPGIYKHITKRYDYLELGMINGMENYSGRYYLCSCGEEDCGCNAVWVKDNVVMLTVHFSSGGASEIEIFPFVTEGMG